MPGLYVRVVERAGAQSKSSGLNRTRGITGHADLSGGDVDEDDAADALAIDVIEHDAARRGSERLEEAADEVVHGMTRFSAAIEFPAQASRFVGIGVESQREAAADVLETMIARRWSRHDVSCRTRIRVMDGQNPARGRSHQ